MPWGDRKRASDPAFVQVMISPRSSDPLGHRRYWPIYAARRALRKASSAARCGLQRRPSSTGSGWPTYYMQEHYAMSTGMQNTLASLVFEGVLERFPKLKVGDDRGRLRLAAGAHLAHGQALGPACALRRRI